MIEASKSQPLSDGLYRKVWVELEYEEGEVVWLKTDCDRRYQITGWKMSQGVLLYELSLGSNYPYFAIAYEITRTKPTP